MLKEVLYGSDTAPYPSGLFNRCPQSGGLEETPSGAYVFSFNVVQGTCTKLLSLGLINWGFGLL